MQRFSEINWFKEFNINVLESRRLFGIGTRFGIWFFNDKNHCSREQGQPYTESYFLCSNYDSRSEVFWCKLILFRRIMIFIMKNLYSDYTNVMKFPASSFRWFEWIRELLSYCSIFSGCCEMISWFFLTNSYHHLSTQYKSRGKLRHVSIDFRKRV